MGLCRGPPLSICPNSAGTLRSESELERKPEVPASTRDEALFLGFLGGSEVKNLPAMQETWVQSLGWEDPLEEGTATHSSMQPSVEGCSFQ